MNNKNILVRFWTILLLLIAGMLLAACSSAGGTEPAADDENMESMDDEEMEDMEHDDEMEGMEHDDDMEHEGDDDHEHGDDVERIPNEGGATITILSPEDGATFSTLDQIIVDVEVENFELGVDGSHWHVYVDGTSFGMVMGGNTDQPLPGLESGEHEISVFLAIGTHEEYQDGDSVTVVVEEE